MKKSHTIFLLVLFCLQQNALAQVFTGDVNLYHQSEVDAFPASCNCTSITGNLRITSLFSGINDLSPLANLVSVGGLLMIQYTQVTNLDGLANLTSVSEDLNIYSNTELNACCSIHDLINGLNGKNVAGSISIYDNAIGCESMEAVTPCEVDYCPDDPDKTEPGTCGCGVPDTDSDGDGIGDVCDACPSIPDPNCDTCEKGKYLICHIPNGNPDNPQQLCLPLSAANAHVGMAAATSGFAVLL